jgi:MFS family permease
METRIKMSTFNTCAVLLIPFVWLYEAAAIGPALGALAQAFPGSSEFSIKMVMSMPFITSIIFSVISGKLAKTMDKKTLLIVGLLIYGVTGIAPAFATNMTQILILRALTGVGVGLVLPLPAAIISENFSGVQRERYLGLAMSVANISNVIISIVIGTLLVMGWRYPFYSFAIVFVVMLIALAGVPKFPPVKQVPDNQTGSVKEKLPRVVFLLALSMLGIWILFGFCTLNLALVVTKEQIGLPWMIGVLMAIPALGSIITGTFLPELDKILGRYLLSLSLLVYGLGFAGLYNAHTTITVVISCLLIGLGSGTLPPYILNVLANKVKAEQNDLSFGIVTACIHLAGFLSPLVQLLISTVGYNSSERYLFLSAAVIIVIVAGIALGAGYKSTAGGSING